MDLHSARTLAKLSLLYFYLAYIMGAFVSMSLSLGTLAAISVDRPLALFLGPTYRQVVTLRRVYVVVIAVWVLSVGHATLALLNPEAVKVVQAIGSIMCLVTASFCYTRIFFRLRHQQSQVHGVTPERETQTIPLNISRYRKTVSTALWLQLALVLCYLPFRILAPFAHPEVENTHSSALYVPLYSTVTLTFFNSTLNPILHCWKIKEVRRRVREIFSTSSVR